MPAGQIFIGVGGWTFEPWRGTFYPEKLPQKRELEFMSRALTSVEVNGTFYRTPKPADFLKWRDETPDGFVFSLKASRYATSRKVLAEAGPSVDRFMQSGLSGLSTKLGPINWQLPPTKKFDGADIDAFLSLLPKEVDGVRTRHALEVRHDSFSDPEALDIARRHNVAIIHAGDSKYPEIAADTADFAYLRIMGTTEGEPNGYSDARIESWATHARAIAKSGRDVYVYVISGFKDRNPLAAIKLIERCNRA